MNEFTFTTILSTIASAISLLYLGYRVGISRSKQAELELLETKNKDLEEEMTVKNRKIQQLTDLYIYERSRIDCRLPNLMDLGNDGIRD